MEQTGLCQERYLHLNPLASYLPICTSPTLCTTSVYCFAYTSHEDKYKTESEKRNCLKTFQRQTTDEWRSNERRVPKKKISIPSLPLVCT